MPICSNIHISSAVIDRLLLLTRGPGLSITEELSQDHLDLWTFIGVSNHIIAYTWFHSLVALQPGGKWVGCASLETNATSRKPRPQAFSWGGFLFVQHNNNNR